MRIRNISLRVVSLLVLTFVFVVATAVFTLFDIRMQTQNMEDSLAEEARTFAREMDAVWEFMDNSQHTINNTTTGVYEFKGLHCAIVGKSVGAIFSAGNNYSIRYTNFEPRRAQDKPDAFETEALALFNEQKDTQEFFRIVSDDPAEVDRAQTSADNGAAQFRYVQALRVNESCLECHGEPAGEIDVTGFPKEGWTLDSVGGAISIVIPLEQQYQALRENVVRDVGFFLLLATFIGIVVFGLMTVFVLRPLEAMKRAFGEVGEGRLRQSMDDAGTAREVASLIDRFNVMSRELSVTYEELEEQVEARTQDLRRANEELAAQRDNLEALSEKLAKESQVKSDLLSMVNHELRTPLTSIITLAQIALESGGADEEERRSWGRGAQVELGAFGDDQRHAGYRPVGRGGDGGVYGADGSGRHRGVGAEHHRPSGCGGAGNAGDDGGSGCPARFRRLREDAAHFGELGQQCGEVHAGRGHRGHHRDAGGGHGRCAGDGVR